MKEKKDRYFLIHKKFSLLSFIVKRNHEIFDATNSFYFIFKIKFTNNNFQLVQH